MSLYAPNQFSGSVADAAADSLLLSLEVEAAAARNAELSRTVEDLQAEVRHLRQHQKGPISPSPQHQRESTPSPPLSESASPPPLPPPLVEPREVFLALDDLLFEVADIRSRLPSCNHVDLTPRSFDPAATVSARALRCLAEVKKLKEALAVSQESNATLVAELRRALGEQVAANERQQLVFAEQRAALERRCTDAQLQGEAAVKRQGERVLNRVVQAAGVQEGCSEAVADERRHTTPLKRQL